VTIPILDDKAMPNLYHRLNALYESGTLFHCFNDCLLDYHTVRAQNVFLWPVHADAKARSPSIALSTALCWGPCHCQVQHSLNFANSLLVHGSKY